MVKKVQWSSISNFLSRGGKLLYLLVLAIFIYSTSVQARVCFLPGGLCPGDKAPSNTTGAANPEQRTPQGGDCMGFNLTQIKCKGQVCEEGWNCESCTNAQGTFYKCTPKPTPPGYTPGLEKCNTACQRYSTPEAPNRFTGNQINGRCDPIPDYTETKPNPCRTYITPDYVCGITISGANVSNMTKNNGDCKVCYTNIIAMSGYSTTKPASCTTYNSKRNGLQSDQDVMCYTAGVSIGENFSTVKRDSDAFTIETQYGSDTFIALNGGQTKKNTEACYRATGCNTANGWLKASDVDGTKFEYLEKMSDGITCRKAIACKESNQWFNSETLGKYKNIYFTTEEETRSGLTCYRATGCYSKAYTSQPDARYFKFDKKTSNNKNCWIVTGKADYAYNAADKKSNFFDYTEATAYLNGTTTQVTYHIVNKDNGRDGCMQYAYESQPDAKYFASASQAQYSNGSSTTKTCWNITGKGTYAYAENEKVGTHFAYDTGKEGYLNGTSTKVKYFDVTDCGAYAYTSQPDAKYFTNNSKVQKKGGVNTDLTCWNITGKGEYAYAENEKLGTHFAYDSGKEGYLNGTSTTAKYFNVSSCGTYAYPSQPNNTYFTFNSKTQKKGGVNTDLTCWNTTGCSTYSYTSSPDTRFFTVDSVTNKKNGVNTDLTCWHATGKATNAYDSAPDAKYFASTSQTAYKDGTATQMTHWIVDSCGTYAYTAAQDTKYFSNDSQTKKKNGSTTDITCYRVTGCGSYAYATAQDTSFFANDSATRKKNGENVDVTCYRVTGCGSNAYTSAQDTSFFANDSASRKKNGENVDITCYRVTGCGSYAYDNQPNTSYFTSDSASRKKNGTTTNVTCYRATDCASGAATSTQNTGIFTVGSNTLYKNGSSTKITCYRATGCAITDTKPGACKTYSTSTQSGVTCYYGISTTGASDCTTSKPTCKTWTSGTDTNGNTVYYSISAAFGSDCTTSPTSCYNYSNKKDTDGTTWYYNPAIIANGATTTKPTYSGCKSWSQGTGTNGTTCYWNVSGELTRDALEQKCGTCGYKTRTASCNASGGGWSYSGWNTCTETAQDSVSQACGCGGTQTRTATCAADGRSWNYSGWSGCSNECTNSQYCDGNATSGTCKSCPSVTAYNASTCYTAEDGTKDVCGKQNYKYACTSNQKCSGGSCVAKECSDYSSDYLPSCSAVSCSSSNTSTYATCTPVYPRSGLTCYTRKTYNCNCTTQSAQTSMTYQTANSSCTMGKDDPDTCGYDDSCMSCADGSSWKSFDGGFCKACDTSTYPITGSCPSNCNCSSCRDGANAGTYHYKVDSAKSGYTVSGNGKSCGIRDLKWYTGDTTIWADGGSSSRSCYSATGYGGYEDYWWVKETWNGSEQGKPNVSISTSGDILSNVYMSNDYDTSDGYRLYFTINDNTSTSSRESTVTITLNSDTSKKIYLKACQNGKTCNWTGYLDNCPSNCNCSPKTDCGVTKYKIDSAKDGYKVDGNTCVPARDCSQYALFWVDNSVYSGYGISGSGMDDVTSQYKSGWGFTSDDHMYKACWDDTVTFSLNPSNCIHALFGWDLGGGYIDERSTTLSFKLTQDVVDRYNITMISSGDSYNYVIFDADELGMSLSDCESEYGSGECKQTSISGCYDVCHTLSYCNSHKNSGYTCKSYTNGYGNTCYQAYKDSSGGNDSGKATIYCDYADIKDANYHQSCYGYFSCSTQRTPCEIDYTVKAGSYTICGGANSTSGEYTTTQIPAGTYYLNVGYEGYIGNSSYEGGGYDGSGAYCYYHKYVPNILMVYGSNQSSTFKCWRVGSSVRSYTTYTESYGCNVSSVNPSEETSYENIDRDNLDDFSTSYNNVSCEYYYNYETESGKYNFEAGKSYYIRAGSHKGYEPVTECWYYSAS